MVAFSASRGVVYATAPAQTTLGAGLFVCEAGPGDAPKPRLLDRVRQAIAARHYSRRTEKAYVHWIKRYIFFHGKRHPAEMGAAEVAPCCEPLRCCDGWGCRMSNFTVQQSGARVARPGC